MFGTVLGKLSVEKFRRVRQIRTLNAFPLSFHLNYKKIRESLITRSQKFIELLGSHH